MNAGRGAELADRLRLAAGRFVEVVQTVDADRWDAVPQSGTWSIGKEVEHVAEAAAYHAWIVRHTVGEASAASRPSLERRQMTSELTIPEAVALLGQRADEGTELLRLLTDAQLALPTRPPRAKGQVLGATIELVLIGHYDGHLADVVAKLDDLDR